MSLARSASSSSSKNACVRVSVAVQLEQGLFTCCAVYAEIDERLMRSGGANDCRVYADCERACGTGRTKERK